MLRLSLRSFVHIPAVLLLLPCVVAQSPRPQTSNLQLPKFFTENPGQQDETACFSTRGSGFHAALARDRIVLSRTKEQAGATVELRFAGGHAEPVGEETLRGVVHSMPAAKDDWRMNMRTHAVVRYPAVWPGVDLVVHHRGGELEYDLVLAPEADLGAVAFEVVGADSVRLGSDGSLELGTKLGSLRQKPPRTWEVAADGTRHDVPSAFVVRGERTYGFDVRRLDARRQLVVDPVLVWGTYMGGSDLDDIKSLAVDAAGHVYVCGITDGGVTATAGAYQTSYGRCYVARLDPTASGAAQLVWYTYLGSPGPDSSLERIALGPTGEVVVLGAANTPFPLTANAYSTTGEAVLAVLSNDGANLLYSTRLIGAGFPGLAFNGLIVEPDGRTLIGLTVRNSSWPTTAGAFSHTNNGGNDQWDIWFAHFDRTLVGSAQLVWATYFGGGPVTERLKGMAMTPGLPGVITFVGNTNNAAATPRTHQTGGFSANGDWFVAQLDGSQTGAAQLRFSHIKGAGQGGGSLGSAAHSVGLAANGEILASYYYNSTLNLARFSADGTTVLADWQWYNGAVFGAENLFVSADGTVTLAGTTGTTVLPVTADAVMPFQASTMATFANSTRPRSNLSSGPTLAAAASIPWDLAVHSCAATHSPSA